MERNANIDVLRILSAAAVIIIHIVSAPVANSSIAIDAILKTTLSLIHALMNWAVPVFFMITGYCMLKKQEVTYKYCFARVIKYVCVLFTVGLAYALMEEIYITKTVNISILIQSVYNVISGKLWDHMWFVYEIIGIYLVMPVIHISLKHDKRSALILTALLFVFNIILPTFEEYIHIGVKLPFVGYLFYVCFGGVMAEFEISKNTSLVICLAGLFAVVWIALDAGNLNFGYNHLAVCAMAMSVFLIVSKTEIKQNRLLVSVSQCTWGIYLIHPLYINVAIKVFRVDVLSAHAYAQLVVLLTVVSLLSFLTTYILRKLPLVKKLF